MAPKIKHDDDTSLAALDSRITRDEQQLVQLKLHRNSRIQAVCLHADVMQEIFHQTCSASEPGQYGEMALALSSVCSRWREIACASSELWSTIDIPSSTWMPMALSRSRQRSLAFILPPRSHPQSITFFLSTLTQYLDRTHTLSVLSHAAWSSTNSLYTHAAPRLVSLNLHHMSLPENLFSQSVPLLRNLSLSHCTFKWENLPLNASLETLSIEDPSIRINPEELLQYVINAGTQLEKLCFRETLQEWIAIEFLPPLSRHHLPQLKSLVLQEVAHPMSLCSILDQLSVSDKLTQLTIVNHNANGNKAIRRALQRLKTVNNTKRQDPIVSLTVTVAQNLLTISLTENIQNNEHYAPRLRSTHLSLGTQLTPNLTQVLQAFTTTPIDTVALSSDFRFSHQLIDQLSKQGGPKHLTVQNDAVHTFTSYILPEAESFYRKLKTLKEDNKNAHHTILKKRLSFHSLTQLHLLCSHDPPETDDDKFKDLLRWLKARSHVGLQLDTLILDNMNAPNTFAATAQQWVTHLEVTERVRT
ncbi:hypothetical protein BDN72DRAFT_861102 [Pluteus cervinus]|uniref:Uncharacterized protein n=1 Tax=Pluteus cervinus TaxID=181527 RepID=A0ACD3AGU3_9AGAR|nr:hypothetical protein BDN72DRAFT_861102 [Pluteus cervinus]